MEEGENKSSILSPLGILTLVCATLIDLAGLIVLCFGLDDFGILDIIGLVFVGGLMFIQSKEITGSKGSQKVMKKVGGKIAKRLGFSFLGEVIPYFGGIAPCWTLAVIFHYKKN